jgi:hypothetical protein
VHNECPTIQAQVHHDALRSVRGDDFVLITRPAYTGTQHWAPLGQAMFQAARSSAPVL